MDIIHVLPENVANQIAAGEVIQRPSSVIKELLENSVDAGADKIDLWVTDAGKTSIKVIDNGKGMSETDARLSFERHATSKIIKAEDLFNLQTMGFRGEALASIAAVAQVELKTRTQSDEIGVCLDIKNGKVVNQESVACERGAQFSVNNLFYNVPARRRFLKSDTTELKNILQEFERVSLIHSDIEFSFYKDDKLISNYRQGSFKKRIVDMFGSSLDKTLLPVHVETSMVTIDGFVGTPDSATLRGMHQFFFVNDRYMRHSYFHRAVMSAYERLIPSDKQISYFISLQVAPDKIDVNIHPSKTEIKFEDEQAIWQILQAVTKEALGTFSQAPQIDFEMGSPLEIPEFQPASKLPKYPSVKLDTSYNPFHSATNKKNQEWQEFFRGIKKDVIETNPATNNQNTLDLFEIPEEQETSPTIKLSPSAYLQHKQFIVMNAKSGLMIIDRYRAKFRILYEKLMSNMENQRGVSQQLLFPELFQIPVSQYTVMKKMAEDFKSVGFDLSDMGGGSYSLKGVPAGVETRNPVELIHILLDKYLENKGTKEEIHNMIALSLAKHDLGCTPNPSSQDKQMSMEEMSSLVEQLFQTSNPKYTPDGKLVVNILDEENIIPLFK